MRIKHLPKLLLLVCLGGAALAEDPGPRTIVFHSFPVNTEVYLEGDGRRQFIGRSGHPLLFIPPRSKDESTSSGYAGGGILLKAEGHQPLRVSLGPTDWLRDRLPPSGAYRLDPDNPWVLIRDYTQAYPALSVLTAFGVVLGGLALGKRLLRPRPSRLAPLKDLEDTLVGAFFGPYRLKERLRKNEPGLYYKALGPEGGEYAVKLARNESPAIQGRFQRECRVGSQLNHPGLLRVIDFGEQDGMLFQVTEVLEGRSLKNDIGNGPLPWSVVGPWARQIGSALAYAHEQGVLHRDLRPDNVFLVENGHLKIVGFGGMGFEARAYQAPEQRAGSMEARSDQYALGLIMLQMLSGRLPKENESPDECLQSERSDASPELRSFLAKSLEKDPNDRFPNMRAFMTALDVLPEQKQ